MIKVTFYPDSDKAEFMKAAKEYQRIWDIEGERITQAIEKISGLKFVEKFINAIVLERPSRSHPMSFRASYSPAVKRATIVHELCHRILSSNEARHIAFGDPDRSLKLHKELDLILYDIWVELYGENFAKKAVEFESKLQPFYKEAWEWALGKTREQRRQVFDQTVKGVTMK